MTQRVRRSNGNDLRAMGGLAELCAWRQPDRLTRIVQRMLADAGIDEGAAERAIDAVDRGRPVIPVAIIVQERMLVQDDPSRQEPTNSRRSAAGVRMAASAKTRHS